MALEVPGPKRIKGCNTISLIAIKETICFCEFMAIFNISHALLPFRYFTIFMGTRNCSLPPKE